MGGRKWNTTRSKSFDKRSMGAQRADWEIYNYKSVHEDINSVSISSSSFVVRMSHEIFTIHVRHSALEEASGKINRSRRIYAKIRLRTNDIFKVNNSQYLPEERKN